ncbi:MAG: carbonic anhydrase [Parasphingopyxis sp.]|uniref:carbonic anhydrase n=1 Tax=Parasphingopyxis sp. TaxID=1920299 RepID=UPI003FA06C93
MPEFGALVDGYYRFRAGDYAAQKRRYDNLDHDGQHPPVMVISCCDSRVDPATIFDTVPGQMFALRNVANLVPPYQPDQRLHGASAAIEFAVVDLKVRHVVVMGHGKCGGITASLRDEDRGIRGPSFIDDWMTIIKQGRDRIVERAAADPALDAQRELEHEAIRISLQNLRTFPYVAEREAEGSLKLHGCWFAIADGELHVMDDESGAFRPA